MKPLLYTITIILLSGCSKKITTPVKVVVRESVFYKDSILVISYGDTTTFKYIFKQ